MYTTQFVILNLIWFNSAFSDILECEGPKWTPVSCQIHRGSVADGENISISNADSKVLTILTLSNVTFTQIPQNIFVHYPIIKVFYVYNNELKSLKVDDFDNALNLIEISFYNTQLQIIPKRAFQKCPNIEKLSLSLNPIQEIAQSAFANLRKLKLFRLVDLPFEKYPDDMLADMIQLEKFKVENCPLKSLTNFFP